ncbi:hypothetical protein L0156_17995 [bacterium]|nr:hypothetical protein [bacterium]
MQTGIEHKFLLKTTEPLTQKNLSQWRDFTIWMPDGIFDTAKIPEID